MLLSLICPWHPGRLSRLQKPHKQGKIFKTQFNYNRSFKFSISCKHAYTFRMFDTRLVHGEIHFGENVIRSTVPNGTKRRILLPSHCCTLSDLQTSPTYSTATLLQGHLPHCQHKWIRKSRWGTPLPLLRRITRHNCIYRKRFTTLNKYICSANRINCLING